MRMASDSMQQKQQLRDQYKSMRAKQIKELCEQKGLKTAGYTDKDQLLDLLISYELKSAGEAKQAEKQGDDDGRFDPSNPDYCIQRVSFGMVEADSIILGEKKTYPTIFLKIKGRDYKFLLDTSCSSAVIPKSKAGLFPHKVLGETGGLGSGKLFAGTRVKIDDVGIAGSLRDVKAVLVDQLPQLPDDATGIMGLDFLESLRACDFNFGTGVFRFGPPEKIVYDGMNSAYKGVSLQRQMFSLLMAEARVQGKGSSFPAFACRGIVDLGSPHTIMNSKAVDACALDPSQIRNSDLVLLGSDGKRIDVREIEIDSVVLGTHTFPLDKIYIADLPGLDMLDLNIVSTVILGRDLFNKDRLILETRNLQLWVKN